MTRIARSAATAPRPDLQGLDLYELITTLSPELVRPTHMAAIVDGFQAICPGPNRKERRARRVDGS